MCGIIGGTKYNDIGNVRKGLKSIMHRGIDDNTIFHYTYNNHYISHNRLGIQDLSEDANQPMVSSDERFCLAFNGELWQSSFDKFDSELRNRKEYEFSTEKSDSELFLYYLMDNIDNLEKALRNIDGMFAFALYDREGTS